MYGDFILIERSGKSEKAERVYVGDLKDKNEAWLRDTLFNHPEILPTDEIDSAFGPLIPLCKELGLGAGVGFIDAVFVNERGRLTIVECKLWKNPEARREVVAQALHYASALANWSYDELKQRLLAAPGRRGDTPFEVVRARVGSGLKEQVFRDNVSQSLREGRVLVLIAGDGIREDVQSITDLVNRHATKAFALGLIEVGLYRFVDGRLVIQPRVLARTEIIERVITIVRTDGGSIVVDESVSEPEDSKPNGGKERFKAWWEPILRMKFDDPEQEPPFWVVTNNIVLNTPFPGIQIKAYALVKGSRIGVFLSGSRRELIHKYLAQDRSLRRALPSGTIVDAEECRVFISTSDCESDSKKLAWLTKMLNEFVNVLRPRLKKWCSEAGS